MLDGFVNYARRIQGVEVTIQMREYGPTTKGRYRMSMRSRGNVNHDSLKFSRVGTWLLYSGVRRPYASDASPDFETREDLGIR